MKIQRKGGEATPEGMLFALGKSNPSLLSPGHHFYVARMRTEASGDSLENKRDETRKWIGLYLGLFVFLALFLGNRGLNEPDEGRYTNIARNYLAPGADIWEPVFSGYDHYDKPPLVYWSEALSLKLFGVNEWAARLVPLFGAYATLAGLGWTVYRLRGPDWAFWSVFFCGTCGQFWFFSRFLTPDMLMTGWCTLGIAAWAECRHRKGHWGWWFVSLICWTLGWWTKATPSLIPLAGLAVGLRVCGDQVGWKTLRPGRLLIGVIVLGSPWYVVMMMRHPELTHFFFGRELMGRITGHVQGRRGPIYYYVLVSAGGWLPWWPLAAWHAWKRVPWRTIGWGDRARMLGIEGWVALPGLVIFSCISSKLPGYTLSLIPWVAVCMTRVLLRWRESCGRQAFAQVISGVAAFMGLIYLAALLIVPRVESGLKRNSSLREVMLALKGQGAEAVYLDYHWPGAEFYYDGKIIYVQAESIQQRSDDDGKGGRPDAAHFCLPELWRVDFDHSTEKNVWLVRYMKTKGSPFDPYQGKSKFAKDIRVGDYLLMRIR
jgi:4-amino-4-deoxy-L-arabinose transferase-like glycosyltransferase